MHEELSNTKLFLIRLIRNSVLDAICKKHPDIHKNGYICYPDLREIRAEHIETLLTADKGALSKLEREVIESLENQDVLAEDVNKKFDRELSFGERMADKVAQFGGSLEVHSFFSYNIDLPGWALMGFICTTTPLIPIPLSS